MLYVSKFPFPGFRATIYGSYWRESKNPLKVISRLVLPYTSCPWFNELSQVVTYWNVWIIWLVSDRLRAKQLGSYRYLFACSQWERHFGCVSQIWTRARNWRWRVPDTSYKPSPPSNNRLHVKKRPRHQGVEDVTLYMYLWFSDLICWLLDLCLPPFSKCPRNWLHIISRFQTSPLFSNISRFGMAP